MEYSPTSIYFVKGFCCNTIPEIIIHLAPNRDLVRLYPKRKKEEGSGWGIFVISRRIPFYNDKIILNNPKNKEKIEDELIGILKQIPFNNFDEFEIGYNNSYLKQGEHPFFEILIMPGNLEKEEFLDYMKNLNEILDKKLLNFYGVNKERLPERNERRKRNEWLKKIITKYY